MSKTSSVAMFLLINLFGIIGCTISAPPIERVKNMQLISHSALPQTSLKQKVTLVKELSVAQFICKDNVVVKVQQQKKEQVAQTKYHKNNTAISVTYLNSTHTLSPTVAQNGKRYSNIRWTWTEKQGKGTLTDNSDKILASECIRKP
ncbi:MliC family protein [[Haemophilus] ducreyi]|uniref:MliC family protein n=1 Tax=Haemophilus ducreyi TaxID=730 RepID=UPI0007CDC4D4|nr:MliC family protein [[Haemophilus] ducreyi]ANF61741.1 hypothetical protein A6037_02755 [[Haemophilus] ducreyi]ANF69449.1 hypothetical protein A6042_05800 [[Haemophilus] ducreyi]SEW19015.1 Membrane-bound lysozyme-inhibitor of c-type lysozyme [[Haemophilus] ducreyi]VEG83073.1 opacity associated protein B [[Haemophilus] ducreyi]